MVLPILSIESAISPILGDAEYQIVCRARDFEYDTTDQEFTVCLSKNSGIIYLNPRPKSEAFNIIYPPNYEPYHFHKFPLIIQKARNLLIYTKVKVILGLLKENDAIMDVGAGSGALIIQLKKKAKINLDFHSVEFNQQCHNRLIAHGISNYQIPLEKLNINHKFSLIIMNQVIEHIWDLHSFLAACHILLKDDGKLFIETPNTSSYDFKIFKRYWGGLHIPRHIYIFNEKNIAALLNQYGFKVIKVQFLLSPAFWIQSLHHLVKDKISEPLARWINIKNPLLLFAFSLIDIITLCLGGKTSNMRIICKKNEPFTDR